MPTALEYPSPSQRGTVISAPEKSTSGNEPASMGMPNIDDTVGRRVDDGKRSTGTKSRTEQCTARKGEMMKEAPRKASFAVGNAGMK